MQNNSTDTETAMDEDPAPQMLLVINIAGLLLGVLACGGNILVLAVGWKYESFRKDHPCVYMICLLAVADCICGKLSIYGEIITRYHICA